jgi:Flp pilus assembly protein TadD
MALINSRCAMALAALAMAATPVCAAQAETLAELDAMSDTSVNEEAGVTQAQSQQARGELLEAIATLERVLADNPKSASARLLHALYLCQIDDPEGGRVELGKLDAKLYTDAIMAEVRGQCTGAQGGGGGG